MNSLGHHIHHKGNARGLTLIELMISLAILGTLAGIAAPIFGTYLDKARSAKSVSDIRTVLEAGITLYEFDTGVLPVSLNNIDRGGILDPWGKGYEFLNFAAVGPSWEDLARKDEFQVPINSDYDLYSQGKDGKTSQELMASWSKDDVIRAGDGGYVGEAVALRKKPKNPKKPKDPNSDQGPKDPKDPNPPGKAK
ncbi:MAG: prepilin-type N-terminal cleavage/methylation domain-containing protein [Deltaproteobacteria bacterium]|nr:prepilin-type N-terminal cleavage/methylation domain-containing protein [Deltaproteobacteria bacterium]